MEEPTITTQKELFAAIAKVQAEIEQPKKTSEGYNYNYADLAAVREATAEVLGKYGLAVMQFPINVGGEIGVTTMLTHESGQSITTSFHAPIEDPTDPQKVGAAITYYRRYTYMAILGIAPEDDDAESARPKRKARPVVRAAVVSKAPAKKQDTPVAPAELIQEAMEVTDFDPEMDPEKKKKILATLQDALDGKIKLKEERVKKLIAEK